MAEDRNQEFLEEADGKTSERLKKQLDFFLKADGEKLITRQTYIGGGSRKETDAEHAWSLALGVILFSEYANEKIDQLKTIKMVLIHDIVEVEAGDSYAYDAKAQATAHEREAKAAEDLYGMLPEDQGKELKALWEEFEAYETPEAKFAHTLDNFQPLQLNDATDGKSWIEHGAKLSDVLRRNRKTGEGAEALWDYEKTLIRKHVKLGNLKND